MKGTLEALLVDFENVKFDNARLIGHYFIFIICNGKTFLLNDGTSLITAYHDKNGSFLTSSFIIASSICKELTLSKQIVIENLITGGITGNDTLFSEIKRFSKNSVSVFPEIDFNFPVVKEETRSLKTRSQALEFQAEVLGNYLNDCKPLADEFGADTGLTGGFDSRLLLGCMKRHFNNLQVHSHFRSEPSIEYEIAKEIADGMKIRFVSPVVKSFKTYNEEELFILMESSYKFYDAQIRIHCNWNEEYNTLEYRLKVLNNKALGFHGIGGEQYRNADRLCLKSWDLKKWLRYKIIRRTGGKVFTDQHTELALIDRMTSNIKEQLGMSINKKRITLGDLKRINNEVFTSSFRGARTSAENKLSFFLSPFADFHVSTSAYEIIPFLDCTNNFEIDLIKIISPVLASFQTNYGYSLKEGEPFRKYFVKTLFENFLPASTNWHIKEIIKPGNPDSIQNKIKTSNLLRQCIRNVGDLDLPLNIEKLLTRQDNAPLVLSLGFFLEKFKSRLN